MNVEEALLETFTFGSGTVGLLVFPICTPEGGEGGVTTGKGNVLDFVGIGLEPEVAEVIGGEVAIGVSSSPPSPSPGKNENRDSDQLERSARLSWRNDNLGAFIADSRVITVAGCDNPPPIPGPLLVPCTPIREVD